MIPAFSQALLNFLSPTSKDSFGLIFIDGINNPLGMRNSIEPFLIWKEFLFFYFQRK
jgi:hypothetical protein